MNTERWRRMEELFDQAAELAESERDRFLDQACAGDLALRRELEQMIGNLRTTRDPLGEAVFAELKLLAEETATSQLGRRFGPFRPVKLLGKGGMGEVYLAERDDAQFSQRVAIKILRPELLDPEAVARFHDERQILAALRHPNIVRLLDGGTGNHLPYLVMELIEGETITAYADQHQLSVRARVELVRQVCAALQYAHQNLIVHRDIKPSNILVDLDGAPKILDFGIAKLLMPASSLERKATTRRGFARFTPEYAAPEQVRGDLVSTATDVYSLGAVLYELVTGRSPHCLGDTRFEIVHTILEIEPLRPSLAGPSARRRELAGDLDNIILKALHKDPGGRYASMAQLSDELGRWLEGLPVAARTSTFGYRARKFVRRNKAMVAAAAVIAATLVGATFVSLRQVRLADEQAAQNAAEWKFRMSQLGQCTGQTSRVGGAGRAGAPETPGAPRNASSPEKPGLPEIVSQPTRSGPPGITRLPENTTLAAKTSLVGTAGLTEGAHSPDQTGLREKLERLGQKRHTVTTKRDKSAAGQDRPAESIAQVDAHRNEEPSDKAEPREAERADAPAQGPVGQHRQNEPPEAERPSSEIITVPLASHVSR